MTRILIAVDVQHDFLPGGALAVPEGDAVIPVLSGLAATVDAVFATRDRHPANHVSFASNHPGHAIGDVIEAGGLTQVLWPDHCVDGTHGMEIHPDLALPADARVVDKGRDPDVDSYSGFFDNGRRHGTGLAEQIAALDPDELLVGGLATDYCVKFTVLDALDLGLPVTVVTDACRGVELEPGDVERALAEMAEAGARLATVAESGKV